jgi:hypothetical protein
MSVLKTIWSLVMLVFLAGLVAYAFVTGKDVVGWLGAVLGVILVGWQLAKPHLHHIKMQFSRSDPLERQQKAKDLKDAAQSISSEVITELKFFDFEKLLEYRIYGSTAYDLLYDEHVGDWEKVIPTRLDVEIGDKGHERWNGNTDLVIALDRAAHKFSQLEKCLNEYREVAGTSDFREEVLAEHALAYERLKAKNYL